MVDYFKNTGATGQMMIRDTGTTVEYWLRAGSGTYNYQLPWAYIANGYSSPWLSFNFVQGGAWQYLGHSTISVSQTVTFKINSSGTVGLGGPTTFSQYINRASVPDAPGTPVISNITHNSAFVTTSFGATHGAPITSTQLWWGLPSSNYGTSTINTDGSDTIGSLSPGTLYYVWARHITSIGNSPWSGRAQFTTLSVPGTPSIPVLSEITQTSMRATFTPNSSGGAPVDFSELKYGTDPTGAVFTTITYTGFPITGLLPSTTYYFWGRSHNAVGYSPWSERSSATTLAGARVKVGAVWKKAIPYVKVDGEWRLATPWVRLMGVWKETI